MTIVASNSLTLSKVNDGTITHTAWSYSADGTDRFTTVYPNLNLLKGTKTPKSITGNNTVNQGGLLYSFDNNSTLNNQGFSVNDTVTFEFDWSATNPASGTFILQWQGQPWGFNVPQIKISSTNGSGHVTHTFNITDLQIASTAVATGIGYRFDNIPTNTIITFSNVIISKAKTSQPWMQSASEVTTTDWPKYIGHYMDFMQADSTNPSDYTWGPMRGDDGVGVTSTVITYANSTSGTTAPSTGWTSSIPTLVKGQYLWTKTVWTYTDTSSKTGYSVTYISKDGTNGTNGTSGVIVSSVAPNSPQTGQLWQDTSTTPQLVKKWTGNEWVIWELYAQNLKADNISAISLNLGDMTGGTVKLMADVDVNGTLKKHGIYQSKMGLLSSGPSLATPSTLSNTQMGEANLNKGELRFIVTNYTEDLKNVQEAGMSDQNTAFINFNSYDNGKDVMTIGSSGDIVFKGITSQDTPWIAMLNGTYYKNMFSRVYISYSIKATSTANIPLGVLPVGLRPFRGLHLTANAWAATLVNDRHIEVRTTGEVTLYNPANGASYDGEVSFTI